MSTKLLVFALISTSAFADIVSISPTSLDFGNQFVGSPNSQAVTLTNSTKKVLNISSVTVTGSFLVQESPCGSTVAPGAQCSFYVLFLPSAGAQSGILSVNDDANNTPQKVKLSGTGVAVVLASIAVAPATSPAD
jgi:Transmembrane protein 131-like N-terminal